MVKIEGNKLYRINGNEWFDQTRFNVVANGSSSKFKPGFLHI